MSRMFYLLETLPAAGGQRGGKPADAQFMGFAGSGYESQREALLAATPTLRLAFQAKDAVQPLFVVIVTINPLNSEAFGMAFALVLADLVLLKGVDIGIIIEYGGTHTIIEQPFNNG